MGPRVVLACAPAEQHDLGLLAFGLALRGRGCRIVYLGTDTPLSSVGDAAHATDAAFVVVSAVSAKRFRAHDDELRKLARTQRLCLGGAGAAGARYGPKVLILSGGPVEEAERLTSLIAPQ